MHHPKGTLIVAFSLHNHVEHIHQVQRSCKLGRYRCI